MRFAGDLRAAGGYSHSIVNDPFFRFKVNGLFIVVYGNTMQNTMLRKSFKMLEKLPIEHCHTAL
jgi:hypothetical protein